MVEFTAEPKQSSLFTKLAIAICVLALAVVAIFFYARYQENSQSDSGGGLAAVPGMLRPGDSNFEYYKDKIRIENAKASLGITFSKARIALISGTISNEGDRTLEALELHITLYDLYDKFSKDRIAMPIRPGVGWGIRPLEPLQKRSFTVGIESVEQLWNPRKLEVKITGLKYK
jgi:hypothetical protein